MTRTCDRKLTEAVSGGGLGRRVPRPAGFGLSGVCPAAALRGKRQNTSNSYFYFFFVPSHFPFLSSAVRYRQPSSRFLFFSPLSTVGLFARICLLVSLCNRSLLCLTRSHRISPLYTSRIAGKQQPRASGLRYHCDVCSACMSCCVKIQHPIR